MVRHQVERGDSRGSIAHDHGGSVNALQRANPRADAMRLQPGNQLELPEGAADVASPRQDRRRRAVTQAVQAPPQPVSLPKPAAPATRKPATPRLDGTLLASLRPTGAGVATVRGECLVKTGVAASEVLAERDRHRVSAIVARFVEIGQAEGVSPALLAAIASRESGCGVSLDAKGYGSRGRDFGIMQVNKVHHPKGTDSSSSAAHLRQATRILREIAGEVRAVHPTWTEAQVMRGAVAGYNVGSGNVRTVANMDVGTAHDDYSADVVARAQYYARTIPALRTR